MIARTKTQNSAAEKRRPIYTLSQVSKTFPQRQIHALDKIDLSLEEGTFSSVIGASGCGKSTLLKIMAALLPPSEGSVVLDGTAVTGPRADIGVMFQQPTLFPWRTVVENIVLPIDIRDGKAAAKAAHPKAHELLSITGLSKFAEVYPNELSGGMAQRAAICRMLVDEPSVLLLDEPFSALDEIMRDLMNMELQRICMERNATAFLVTHSISEAVLLSDIVYIMSPRPGRFVEKVMIELPRPRTLEMMTTKKFGLLVDKIRSHLNVGDFE